MKVGTKNGASHLAVASMVGTLGLVLALGSPALAVTYSTQYEMSADPSTASGVLDANPGDANGAGLLTVGSAGSGSTFAGGIMHFIDNTSSGNFGYYWNQAAAADISFTIDLRVKANNNVNASADARSIAVNGGRTVTPDAAKGRGLRLNNPGGGGCTNGSAQLTSGASSEACMDLSAFRRLRIAVDGASSSINVYDLDAGGAAVLTAATVGDGGIAGEISNGGFQIGSLSGGITTATDFEVDYFRVLLGTAVNDSTTVIDQIPPPSCLVTVTPQAPQTLTGYELGATPPPPVVNYTIDNLGSSTINYTAVEIDTLGVATDYPWLTLSPTNGSVTGGNNTVVAATSSTSSLTPGVYTAYVKLTDDCPVSPSFTDTFTYPNGNLNGNGGWAGTATSEILVTGNEVHMPGGSGGFDAIRAVSCSADGTGILSAKFKIKNVSGGGSTMWRLEFRDAANAIICDVGGTASNLNLRNAQNNEFILNVPLVSTYTHFDLRFHTYSDKLELYDITTTPTLLGAINIGTVGGVAPGDAIGFVRFERRSNAGAAGHELAFDDLELSVIEPHIRKINLNVVGCSIEVLEPRLRYIGPCATSSTTTEVFTIQNNGSADWTHYQGFEVTDEDWMTVTYTSSPVVRFATATVTATIDWSQVPITGPGDNQTSRIRFGGSCDGGNTYFFVTPSAGANDNAVNVFDNTTAPLKLLYNGDVSPSVNDAAGTGYRFELFDSSVEQGTLVSDPGVGQASDGLAYLLNDTGGSKTKWRSILNSGAAGPNIDSRSGATAMARVKVVSATGGNNGNLMILETNIGGSYHWGGANNVAREVQRNASATVSGDGAYHILRMTSKDTQIAGTGIVVNLYLDENPTPVVTINNATTNDGGNSGLDAIGFGASSTADAQDIYFDWVTGTNAGAFAPGDEVACIGSLIPPSNCNVPRVDVDDDGDVDMDDFAVFQTCYTGSGSFSLSQQCDCFDADNDNDVDIADFNDFVDCETGAGVPWVTSVNCPN